MRKFPLRVRAAGQRILLLCAVPFALMLTTQLAHSHAAPFGITGYPVLVLHPFIVIDHALCLAAAGLLAGQQQTIRVPVALLWLLAGLAAGFTGIFFIPSFPGDIFLPYLGAVTLAVVVAVAPALNRWVAGVLVIAAGVLVGFNTYPEAPMLFVLAMTLGGLMLGAGVLFCMVAWPVSLLQRDWQRIGIRIAGSWIVAIVALILALALRP